MRAARGQTLVLFALSMLLIALMVLMTVSIGAKAKDKLDLQAAADAAAYSNAIAAARTLNTAALLNRAAVSEWVAMAGIQALTAWGTTTSAYLGALGELAYDFQKPVPGQWCWMENSIGSPRSNPACAAGWAVCDSGCPADCAARTNETRDAAYDFWHARYSLYSPGSDSVGRQCLNGVCNGPQWPRNRLGQLDKQVADQQQAVWRAVHNLTQLEANTYQQLQRVLSNGTLSDEVLRAEQGSMAGLTTHAHSQAWGELSNVVNVNDSPSHDNAALQATMGSIDKLFPTYFLSPPPQVDQFLATIQADLNATHPGKFQFSRSQGGFNGCAFFTKAATLDSPDAMTGGLDLLDTYCTGTSGDTWLGWKAAAAVAVDSVQMRYKDGCTGQWRQAPDAPARNAQQIGKVVAVIFSPNDQAPSAFHVGAEDEFYAQGGFVGGCHGNHGYWNVIDPNDHQLGRYVGGEDDIVPGGLAYVFPPGSTSPQGTGGQPKMPTLFARHYGALAHDPWDLTVQIDPGAKLEIGGPTVANAPAVQGALANGITYYHRRGYWVEPANLLNPYWRATLVPANADAPDGRDQTVQELRQAGFNQSATLYRGLQGLSFKGVQ
jgi:hypothetical protein